MKKKKLIAYNSSSYYYGIGSQIRRKRTGKMNHVRITYQCDKLEPMYGNDRLSTSSYKKKDYHGQMLTRTRRQRLG